MRHLFSTLLIALSLISCRQNAADETATAETHVVAPPVGGTDTISATQEAAPAADVACTEDEQLVYEEGTFSTYTEYRMRGKGVVSFTLDVNDRLDFEYEDEASFGSIVLNEDQTYFNTTMPRKIVARKVVTNSDFATFDFDAEDVKTEKDYLLVYINKKKYWVKKAGVKYTFSTWEKYLQENPLMLKECNLLKDASGKVIPKSKGLAFKVTQIKGDVAHIKSVNDCLGEDAAPFQDMQGWITWKKGNSLMVDFASCN